VTEYPTIAVLGASGLIGQSITESLRGEGFRVVALARRFTSAQHSLFTPHLVEAPLAELGEAELRAILEGEGAGVVVNCLGVLQDAPGASTSRVHQDVVARLLSALAGMRVPPLLIHLSMPGEAAGDATAFSRSKREGERLIAASPVPHVILRAGFVIAPAAYGGSALLRALAMLPIGLPPRVADRPFAATAIEDISASIALAAREWAEGRRDRRTTWEVCEREPGTVGGVVEAFRRRLGGPKPIVTAPLWSMRLGARLGDLISRLGWSPPIRTTALLEMLRGVVGDPSRWMAETGLEPVPLQAAAGRLPVTVQERWFARLFLAKALILPTLVVFWIASGLIALTLSFREASALLTARGFPAGFADATTVVSSLLDIAIGCLIAHRRTCGLGLLAGIAVSLGYMAGAAVLTPDLWIEPLGALVKTGPAIVLMLVGLLILDPR
jgi:uncharacterized protein YbjT (DUF2867 family)